jgi:hypothetical protein
MIFTDINMLMISCRPVLILKLWNYGKQNCTTRDLIAHKDFSSLTLPTQSCFRVCPVILTFFFFIYVADTTAEEPFNVFPGGGLYDQNNNTRRRQEQQHKENFSQNGEVWVCFLNACAIESEMGSQLICECFV